MAKITMFKGYEGVPPIPKPREKVLPNVVRAQDGVPVKYPDCEGIGVRIVHPANPKAPAQNLGLVMFYIPPHVVLAPGQPPHRRVLRHYTWERRHDARRRENRCAGRHLYPSTAMVRTRHREHRK